MLSHNLPYPTATMFVVDHNLTIEDFIIKVNRPKQPADITYLTTVGKNNRRITSCADAITALEHAVKDARANNKHTGMLVVPRVPGIVVYDENSKVVTGCTAYCLPHLVIMLNNPCVLLAFFDRHVAVYTHTNRCRSPI